MVKSYLRYEAGAVFGLVVSPAAHPAALFDTAQGPRRAIAATGENVVTWDLKRGQQVRPHAPAPSLRTPHFLLSFYPLRWHGSSALCTLSGPAPILLI